MKDFSNHTIQQTSPLIEAFKQLNKVTVHQTLFVLNSDQQLIGTLTDGDIRRGFIENKTLNDSVDMFMNREFHFLMNEISPQKIKEFRKKFVKLIPLLDENKKIIKVFDLTRLKTILPMDALIMAGGKGERLRPLTDRKPKPMLTLGDKPIIEHNIDRLISYGIENIYISVNYLADQIMDYFGDGSSKGVNIQYIQEERFLGTIGAMRLVENFNNPFVLVMNSDLFTDADIEDLFLNLNWNKADIAVASIPYTVNIPFAILNRNNGQITGLKEKPTHTHYANAGIYLMRKKVTDLIPDQKYYNATDLIEKVIETGGKVIDNPLTGYWIDIGRLDDYKKATELIKHMT